MTLIAASQKEGGLVFLWRPLVSLLLSPALKVDPEKVTHPATDLSTHSEQKDISQA